MQDDDEIEVFDCPYRNQLERTLEILELEMERKKELQAQEREATIENKHLTETCIEQRNVVQSLKSQLQDILLKSTADQCIQTEETSETIQKALDKIAPFKDRYQDLYPNLSKLIVQDAMPREEIEFDDRTVDSILSEALGLQQTTSEPDSSNLSSQSNLSENMHASPLEPKLPLSKSKENKVESKKSGFDWGILKKLAGADKEKNSPDFDSRLEVSSEKQTTQTKAQKEWENILGEISKGKSVWTLKNRIDFQLKASCFIPQKKRGSIWRRLLGNRSRVTPRIYKMLLLQLPNSNPHVKKCIMLDVNRSFSKLANSQAFEKVKEEAIRILQLFEVSYRDTDPSARHRLCPRHVLHCRGSAHEHEHLQRLQVFLQLDLRQ